VTRRKTGLAILATALVAGVWGGCRSTTLQPLPLPQVDLSRFMGDWYVIANIPTPFVQNAYNAVQNYQLNADGTIATTFTFHEGGFDGKSRTLRPKAYVREGTSNAEWGLQFGPIRAEYLIAYLNPEYTETVIARSNRDFVWIMARTPEIPEADYDRLVEQIAKWGYDTEKLERVPQRW
jgi:apolipoprotein D and lipocalin family protein